MKKALLLAVVLTVISGTAAAQAAEPAAVPSLLLVRVVELNAIGPDNRTHTLYSDDTGVLTSMKDLGRVTYQVRAGTLPEGAYHTLSVRLADDATALYSDGRKEARTLQAMALPGEQRIGGMLWVEGGNVSPLRTRPHRALSKRAHGDDD